MPSNLPQELALIHINNFRSDIGPEDLKSVWLNADIIDYIVKNAESEGINGLRIYMARYASGVTPVTENPALANLQTMIVVPTKNDNGINVDINEAYFDYALPCPQSCRGDAGV